MRILSVVTLVTPLNEYGGPVRVAVNQAQALRERGHEVTLVAAERGWSGSVPIDVEGVPAMLRRARRLVPGTGFAGLAAPALLPWVLRRLPEIDVVHVHLARDLVTLPVAALVRAHRTPYVLQCHGMVDTSERRSARVLDALATRAVLHDAAAVLHLTDVEAREVEAVGGADLRLQHLPNGVPDGGDPTAPTTVRVLFLARLAPRKRPELMVRLARRLARTAPQAEVVLVGPDEGSGRAVSEAVRKARDNGAVVRWEGPVAPGETLEHMRRASIYVLPAVDEPYPMSVLEAMSLALPVVVTDTCGLAPVVRAAGGGLVVGPSEDELVTAVERLLADPAEARAMGVRGRAHVRAELSMSRIAERLELTYATAVRDGNPASS